MKDYVVTISIFKQVSPDDWEARHKSKVVNSYTTIEEIEIWVKKYGKDLDFTDVKISEVSS